MADVVARLFATFDAALIIDELVGRGVSPTDAERFVTMGSKHFRVFLARRALDEVGFYQSVERREAARAAKRLAELRAAEPQLVTSAPIPVPKATRRRRVHKEQTGEGASQ